MIMNWGQRFKNNQRHCSFLFTNIFLVDQGPICLSTNASSYPMFFERLGFFPIL